MKVIYVTKNKIQFLILFLSIDVKLSTSKGSLEFELNFPGSVEVDCVGRTLEIIIPSGTWVGFRGRTRCYFRRN